MNDWLCWHIQAREQKIGEFRRSIQVQDGSHIPPEIVHHCRYIPAGSEGPGLKCDCNGFSISYSLFQIALCVCGHDKHYHGLFHEKLHLKRRLFDIFMAQVIAPLVQVSLTPLNECIDSIVQEALDVPCCQQVVTNNHESEWINVVLLLRSAAQYQASIDSVRKAINLSNNNGSPLTLPL